MTTDNHMIDRRRLAGEFRRMIAEKKRTLLLLALAVASAVMLPSFYMQFVQLQWAKSMLMTQADVDYEYITRTMRSGVPATQAFIFATVMFIIGAVSASAMFESLGSKEGRCAQLMVPTTMSEKFVVQWSVYVAGFFMIFLLATIVTDLLRPMLFAVRAPEDVKLYTSYYWLKKMYETGELYYNFRIIMSAYLFIISLFSLGALVWKSNSFLKTLALLGVIGLGSLIWWMMWGVTFDSHPGIYCDKVYRWLPLVLCILAVINWLIAYRRLTETDVTAHVGPYNQ